VIPLLLFVGHQEDDSSIAKINKINNVFMLSYRFSPILILSTAALIIYSSSIALSLTPSEIITIAKKSVVRIDGANSGTGFIIKKNGNIYTVLN
jgi:hypothetical protein